MSSVRRKGPVISLNCSAFIGNLSSSEGVHARARANHANDDAQKGCTMQLNGITLNDEKMYEMMYKFDTRNLSLAGFITEEPFVLTRVSCPASNINSTNKTEASYVCYLLLVFLYQSQQAFSKTSANRNCYKTVCVGAISSLEIERTSRSS